MDSSYMSLPERISEQFSEVDSDITVDLRKNDPSYSNLSRQMEEMKKQNPDTYTDSAFYEKVLKIGPASFNVLRDYVLENR